MIESLLRECNACFETKKIEPSKNEDTSKMKCSICKQEGHNKRSCKKMTAPVSAPKIEAETDVKIIPQVKVEMPLQTEDTGKMFEKFSELDINIVIKIQKNFRKKYQSIQDLIQDLQDYGVTEKKNITKEKTRNNNQCYAFREGGNFGEQITCSIFPGTIGSASKGGMSFDNKTLDKDKNIKHAKEVKFVCLVGTKECKSCKQKCPPFQKKCIYCNGEKFKNNSDSRASISSKAHILYKEYINEYIIYVQDYDENKEIISIIGYKFLSKNMYFDNYIQNQYDSGNKKGGTCNLLPYSFDWYMSGPIKFIDIHIDISKFEPIIKYNIYNIHSEIYDNIPVVDFEKILNKNELELFYELPKEKRSEYLHVCSKLNIRNKSIGKSRGITTRK